MNTRTRRHLAIRCSQLFLLAALILSFGAFPGITQANASSAYFSYVLSLPNKIPPTNGFRSTLVVRNPGATLVNLSFNILNAATGQTAAQFIDTVPAYATIERPLEQVASLPSGTYNVVISSDNLIESLARIDHGNGDQLAIVRGIPGAGGGLSPSMIANNLFFGPVYQNSALILLNQNSFAVNSSIIFFQPNGTVAGTVSSPAIAANGSIAVSNFSQLAAGTAYFVVVSSDGPLSGISRVATPSHADYEMQPSLGSGSIRAFLPRALKSVDEGGGARSTHLMVANAGTSIGSVNVTYSNGTSTFNQTVNGLAADGFAYINLADEAFLPSGSIWAVSAVSDGQPIVLGEITDLDNAPYLTSSASYAGVVNGAAIDLPYLIHNAGDRTLFSVQNLGTQDTTLSIQYYDANGGSVAGPSQLLVHPGAAARVNLDTLAQFVGSAAVTSSAAPIAATVDVFTNACTAPSDAAITRQSSADIIAGDTVTFSTAATGDAPLHYAWTLNTNPVGLNASSYDAAFSAAGSDTLGVTVSNACGQASASLGVDVKPLTVSVTRSPSGVLYLGDEVLISATTNSSASFNYAWTVDGKPIDGNADQLDVHFGAPAGSHTFEVTISNGVAQASGTLTFDVQAVTVTVTSLPTANIFVGDPVTFSANVSGTAPVHYAWNVDGTPVGSDASFYAASFAQAGDYTIGVATSNIYGQGAGSLKITVKPHLPDLSSSHKNVDFAQFNATGDTLSYTLTLHNSGLGSANASLSDPIPAHTDLVTGSPSASDGGAVTLQNGALTWSGAIAPGAIVTITYQVTVQAVQIGDKIVNTATLQDGFGGSLQLTAESLYSPGFTFSIENGAVYTNKNPVMLSYSWDPTKNIAFVQFSNDGGFPINANTSAWQPVNPANLTYAGWMLAILKDTVMPRTVYARFKDGTGAIYGSTFQDDIIFDAVPPQVSQVEIIPSGNLTPATAGTHATLRVTSTDGNSGIESIIVSDDLSFANQTVVAATGTVTEIPWTLQPNGKVYVRVTDKAGNSSTIHTQQGAVPQWFVPGVRR